MHVFNYKGETYEFIPFILQLIDCYVEAYMHVFNYEEKHMNKCPLFYSWWDCYVEAYMHVFNYKGETYEFIPFILQLIDCYVEAYMHVFNREEKRSLAQVIMNLMYKRPRFDFEDSYFIKALRAEAVIMRQMTMLVKNIMDRQVWGVSKYDRQVGGVSKCETTALVGGISKCEDRGVSQCEKIGRGISQCEA